MTIPKNKLRDRRPFIKGQLNWFEISREVIFEEEQNNDRATFDYILEAGQLGCYSEEYLPNGLEKGGNKRIDVTALVIDEKQKKCCFRLYDLKTNIGSEGDLMKLAEQWKRGLFYVQNYILSMLQDYEIDGNVGVITRFYDKERIKRQIDVLQNEIRDKSMLGAHSLVGRRMRQEILKLVKRKELLADFYNLRYQYNSGDGNKVEYCFDVRESEHAVVTIRMYAG